MILVATLAHGAVTLDAVETDARHQGLTRLDTSNRTMYCVGCPRLNDGYPRHAARRRV